MSRWWGPIVLCGCLAMGGFDRIAALAQTDGVRIAKIWVEGVQRIEAETVRSYMGLGVGDAFNSEKLDQALKKLFATGLFADVTLRREGTAIIVRVVENPIINRRVFEGNNRISDEILEAEVQLRPRVVYTRTRVRNDVKRIIDVYQRSGRFAATVEPKVIQLPQNRVDLVFEVNEGPLTEIRSIGFVGNKRFSDRRLRKIVQTKESAWYRFLTGGDTYDPDRLTFDRELLRRHYLAQGYADFRVASAIAELAPDRKGFFVTFTIEEGERYKFRGIDVVVRLPNLEVEHLRSLIHTQEGDWYDADAVDSAIENLTDELGSLGYAFVDIRPRVRRDRDSRTIDVTFDVQEGPRVYIERINVSGNVRTLDRVIRREFQLVEGDAFNTSKIRRSRRRIRNLGFFERVELTNVPGSSVDKTVVNVKVAEQSTGELSFGVGFSSTAGILADTSIRERNLLGRGQDLKFSISFGQLSQQLELSFTEPYFLDRRLAAGFDAFKRIRDLQVASSFDKDSLGLKFRGTYSITQPLSQSLKYTIREDEVTNIESNASLLIKQQEGTSVTSLIGQSLIYDRRDRRFQPTTGWFAQLSNDFAGLGGNVKYIRTTVSGGKYYSITDGVVVGLTAETGYIVGLDQDVRIVDRYFVGGKNLRGFAGAGIGPRDRMSEDSLGGNISYTGSVELRFPLGLPDELAITGRAFADIGGLTDIDGADTSLIFDENSVRASVGTGIGWRSPFGPIRMDLAFPLLKEDFDKTEVFRFSFGTRF